MSHQQRGQVMSSFVAVAAAIAVVIGLLVLFGTRDPGNSAAGPPNSPSPASSTPSPSGTPTSPVTQTPVPTRPPTVVPTRTPTPTPTPSSTPTPTDEPTNTETAPANRPAVEIYNNTTRRGLAERVAQRARNEGWQVAGIDNWRGKLVGSTVYHPDGMRAAAQALAGDLGVGRVKPALGNMKRDRLTVILTKDYSE